MKILLDMNLSPDLVDRFSEYNIEAKHWISIGSPVAKDSEIMIFARENDYVVFTHDLDFGAILAATQAEGPSVIQVRTQSLLSEILVEMVANVLVENQAALEKGALVTIDATKKRVRILPLDKY
jgi:predicted nuclease of predicted toxin-antitoxin system